MNPRLWPAVALGFLLASGLTAAATPPARRPAAKASPRKPAALSDQETAERWFKSLTPREKAAQLVVIQFSGFTPRPRSKDARKFYQLTAIERVGGLVLINSSGVRPAAGETAAFLNRVQKAAKIPLIVAGDFERGLSMRIDGTTVFPHAMAFTATGDPSLERMEASITAREARALGFHWLLFPDADVNNNPDNPIINIRSFGEDPADVSRMVSAFIEGVLASPGPRLMTTAKHFPGHGDTTTDTHQNLAVIPGDRDRLERIEWAPFRAAIRSGVDAVMTGHLAVPALEDPGLPATLSQKLLTGALRGDLGFQGIVVTDALQMTGLAQGFSSGEAAVRALQAGADVLLMPSDPVAAINAVLSAVRTGRLTQKRVDESVRRVLAAKVRVGLATRRLVDTNAIPSSVDTSESNAAARRVAERSLTLLRNQRGFLPLRAGGPATAFLLLAENRRGVQGQAMASEIRKRMPGAAVVPLDAGMTDAELDAGVAGTAGASRYVAAAFASVAAFKGNPALGGSLPRVLQSLIDGGKPVALLAMGNPYLLRNFPEVAAYLTTYSTVPPSEIAAVRALFGEIPTPGRLPVTIPGLAKYGDGLALPLQ